MRRLTISLALLLALAGLGVWNCQRLERISGHLAALLTQAEQFAASGDWEQAEQLTRQAQADWEDTTLYLYIVLRHDYTDEVDTGFREVLALIRWQETPEYASANGELLGQVLHFSDAEQLNWKNFL